MNAVGFTGTAQGMTSTQLATAKKVLSNLYAPGGVFHHGDCVGADAEAHRLAQAQGFRIIIHPPSNPSKRAFCTGDEARVGKPYLDRNQDIVNECRVLVATPKGFAEEQRSGTWATVRRARQAGKTVFIIWPDGKVQQS
jgi:hypothetical protein